MKALWYPRFNLRDYFVTKEFSDRYCCYIRIMNLDKDIDYWSNFSRTYNINWSDLSNEETIFLEFDTEYEMINFVNNYPENFGYCLGYSMGVIITENT